MREDVIRLCAGVNDNYSVVADCTRVAAGVVVIEPTSPVLISDSASSSPVVFCKIPAPAVVLIKIYAVSVLFFCGGLLMLVICTTFTVLVTMLAVQRPVIVTLLLVVSGENVSEEDVTPPKSPSPEKESAFAVTSSSDGNVISA